MAETRSTFKAGIADYLDSNIDRGIRLAIKVSKSNARNNKTTKG